MICFVRLIGIVWLGESRSEEVRHAHEASAWMLVPMGILALMCVLAAVFPSVLLSFFSRLVETMFALPDGVFMKTLDSAQSPLGLLGLLNAVVWVILVLVGLLYWALVRRGRVAVGSTWGCGYLAPTSRMQYTGQSFSELMVSRLYWRPWKPTTRVVAPEGLFPMEGKMTTGYPDTLSRLLYRPSFAWLVERLRSLRWVQQGKLHCYMVYFVVTLVAGFIWLAIRHWVMHD
jgi:NADH:ubiquinone oxidoreductase subunit 5 (subunit L)/multisubunit Na+/H+ antiporter MnhA subunit